MSIYCNGRLIEVKGHRVSWRDGVGTREVYIAIYYEPTAWWTTAKDMHYNSEFSCKGGHEEIAAAIEASTRLPDIGSICRNCGIEDGEVRNMWTGLGGLHDQGDGTYLCDNCCMAIDRANICEDCGGIMRHIGNVTSAEGVELALCSCDTCDANSEEEIAEEPYYPPCGI